MTKEEKQLEKDWEIFNTLRSICRLPLWSIESYKWYLQTEQDKKDELVNSEYNKINLAMSK